LLIISRPTCSNNWPSRGTWYTRSGLINCLHSELVFLKLLQVLHFHLRLTHWVHVDYFPVASGWFQLDDVALQFTAPDVARLVPVQRNRVRRHAVDNRLTGRTTWCCKYYICNIRSTFYQTKRSQSHAYNEISSDVQDTLKDKTVSSRHFYFYKDTFTKRLPAGSVFCN